ncbi:hypothetical protein C8R43DRAFT_1121131 [Mycena crocata]|nr:hypothetical protein C8R43DRAFT_1121131 [Mycena crocata]
MAGLPINPYGYPSTASVCILFCGAVRHLYRECDIIYGRSSPPSFSEVQWRCSDGLTLLAAANFVILGRIIIQSGSGYSRLTPKQYTTIFLICDIVSLFVQGIGGGIAAQAVTHSKSSKTGGNIMLLGIIQQLGASLGIFHPLFKSHTLKRGNYRGVHTLCGGVPV